MIFAGESRCYTSHDSGKVSLLQKCSAQTELHLKSAAPVILIANLSKDLVNGLRGTVVAMQEQCVEVFFTTLQRNVTITPYSFCAFDPSTGRDGAFRSQIPLLLGFAFTVHRTQGQSLERLVVDCQK